MGKISRWDQLESVIMEEDVGHCQVVGNVTQGKPVTEGDSSEDIRIPIMVTPGRGNLFRDASVTVRPLPQDEPPGVEIKTSLPGSIVGSPMINVKKSHVSPTTQSVPGNITLSDAAAGREHGNVVETGSLQTTTKSIRRALRLQRLRDTKAVTTLLILFGAFTICWTPYVAVCFLVQSGGQVSSIFYGASFITALCNSAINVFVYGLLNTKIRTGTKCLYRSFVSICQWETVDDRPFAQNISHSVMLPGVEDPRAFVKKQSSF